MRALIWIINIAALCALISAIVARRAWRSWTWFGVFLAATLSRDVALSFISSRSRYFWTYLAFEPALAILLAAVVVEVWRARTATLISVGRAGQYFLISALVVATLAVVVMIIAGGGSWDAQLRQLLTVRQWLVSIMGVFTLAGAAMLSALGSRCAGSVRNQHWLLALYLGLQALAMAAGALAGQTALATINIAALAVGAILYGWWAVVIAPAPSDPPPAPGPRAEEVERQVGEFLATLRAAAGAPQDRPPRT